MTCFGFFFFFLLCRSSCQSQRKLPLTLRIVGETEPKVQFVKPPVKSASVQHNQSGHSSCGVWIIHLEGAT